MKLQFKMGSCMVRILKISESEYHSSAEFPNSAASKYASLQLALSLSDKKLRVETVFVRYFFQRWELQIPDFFSLPNYKFGRTEISARMLNLQMEY